jgi:hypothetical protein
MMSHDPLRSRHALNNGLTLEFWDRSQPVAGDRWLAALEARIVIPVTASSLPPDLSPREAEILAALGPEISFSLKDERHFIAAEQVPAILTEMEDRLLPLVSQYAGHPDFPGRFIGKKYAEHLERRRWRQP